MHPELSPKSDLRIGSIVIDCINFDKMLAFWQEALHYIPRAPAKGGWVVLRDPAKRNVNISLNQVPERLMGRNWLHFDLYGGLAQDRGRLRIQRCFQNKVQRTFGAQVRYPPLCNVRDDREPNV